MRTRTKGKGLLTGGLSVLVVGGLGLAATSIFRVALIVNLGIIAANAAPIPCAVLMGAGGVTAILGAVPLIRQQADRLSEGRRTALLAEGKETPEAIRSELERLKKLHPLLTMDLDSCLEQLDSMERRKTQLDEILRISKTEIEWSSVVDLLQSVEKVICTNLRAVIVRGIACDQSDQPNSAHYDELKKLIQAQEAKNQKLLDESKEALNHVADLISGDTSGGGSVELESWLKVLRGMVAQNASAEGEGNQQQNTSVEEEKTA
ncbi:MAG: hypothetical protein FWD65_02810 [Coriobacteriia bacterium]|nr:hypothetical protein [Coriobacteriia bacterium]